jgi:predicted regulator of Ras-like GTPase activity (Roadblock/LC7/MglB family)
MNTRNDGRNWGYLLDRLCQVAGIHHALAVSGDGLKLAHSRDLSTDMADQLAAFTSGLSSLTTGAVHLMGAGRVRQTVVDAEGGYVIVMTIDESADDKSILTVLADKLCDLGQVTFEMATLITSSGPALTPGRR